MALPPRTPVDAPPRTLERDFRDPPADAVEAIGELTVQIARLCRVLEDSTSPGLEARVPPLPMPSIRYAATLPPGASRRPSFLERAKAKRVSVPAAAGWSGALLLAVEVLRIVLQHLQ